MKLTVAVPVVAVTPTMVGGPAGTTIEADDVDHADAPTEFTARTAHRYVRPWDRPFTVTGDAVPLAVRVVPPLPEAHRTSNDVTGAPERFSGSTKLTDVDCPDGCGGVDAAT